MECKQDKNKQDCPCTYEPCERKGRCCDCLDYHRRDRELPACYFPPEVEKTFDRSVERYLEITKSREK